MRTAIVTTGLLILLTLSVASANNNARGTKEFSWDTELCSNTARFDSGKITEEEIRGAFFLSKDFINSLPSALSFTQLKGLSADKIKYLRETKTKATDDLLAKLRGLALPKDQGWSELRKETERDVKLTHFLETNQIDFYLTGEEKKLSREFEGEMIPGECLNKISSVETKASEEARFKAVTLSWGNCVNKFLRHNIEPTTLIKKLEDTYLKDIKQECDEP